MKETTFIENKKEKWKRFEKLNKSNYQDPEELSDLFVEITEDLSYAKTNYPKRTVRVYLNYLAQNVFTNFYKKSKSETNKFWSFWSYALPLEMYRSRREHLISWVTFLLAILIGWFSIESDSSFASNFLPDHYIRTTLDNIESGKPMNIYATQGEGLMTVSITINNLRVLFMAFVLGIFATIGSYYILIFNGLMVGTFLGFMHINGVETENLLTIFLHGAFELSVIAIGGTAGIVLGKGLLFPGTYTRGQSLQIAGKRGLKIVIGLAPFIIIAGLIEGFVSRYDNMPLWGKLTIIISSFSIIGFYFILYPWLKFKGKDELFLEQKPTFREHKKINLHKIKKTSQIFAETFTLAKTHFKVYSKTVFLIILPLSFLYLVVHFYFNSNLYGFVRSSLTLNNFEVGSKLHEQYWYSILGRFLGTGSHFNLAGAISTMLLVLLNLTAVLHAVFGFKNNKDSYYKSYFKYTLKNSWKIALLLIPYLAIFYFGNGFLRFIGALISPLFFFAVISIVKNNKLSPKLGLGIKNYGSNFGVFIVFGIILALLFLFHVTPAFTIIKEFIAMHLIPFFDNEIAISAAIKCGFYLLLLHLILPLFIQAFILQVYSIEEKEEAIGLKERLKSFGTTNKIFESNE